MRRMFQIMLCLCLLLTCVACTPALPNQSDNTHTTSDSTVPATSTVPTQGQDTVPPSLYQAPMTALSVPVISEEAFSDDGTLLFTYSYQDFSLILQDPHVAEEITLDFLNRVDFSNSPAMEVYESAQTAYTDQSNWSPYFYSELYTPARLDQGILSLCGSELLYDGSPRSASVNLSVTYDLLTGKVIEEITEILAPDYSAEELCQLIIDALADRADDGVLFADYEYIISDMFATNAPVENWYLSERGLCFYFSPYEIAPYSAGTVVAEVPYESLGGLLKDSYFPAEQADLYGAVIIEPFTDTVDYLQIAEIVIDSGAEQHLVHTDGTLFDLRLEIQAKAEGSESTAQNATVFAAASLSSGDALVIQCSTETLASLRLTYESGGSTKTQELSPADSAAH